MGIRSPIFGLDKKISLDEVTPVEIQCSTCLLSLQYQNKIKGRFLWQCFRCEKKYFVLKTIGNYLIEETWSATK